MAQAFGSLGDEEIISGINITPLVDVVLVLLIIFMITAPAIYQSAIKVQLPKAQTGEKAEQTALNFTITREGQVIWEKNPVEWDTLIQKLNSLKDRVNETAVISADQATPHGTVIKLMDALRQVGLTRFALNVEGPAK